MKSCSSRVHHIFRPAFLVCYLLLIISIWACYKLQLSFDNIFPQQFSIAKDFFTHALYPALDYQAEQLPEGIEPLILKALKAAGYTLVFAAAAISLALPVGFVLAIFASEAFWKCFSLNGFATLLRQLLRAVLTVVRSIHELLWAVLFLAAFGLNNTTAVLAIAVPFSAVFAKIFSEILDETEADCFLALKNSGASTIQAFAFGRLPLALGDMAAYAVYRLECAVRSSAVLGFFGFPTLGYYISASFENLFYGEVWTYLYVLFFLILGLDLFSRALRRDFIV